MDIRRARRRHLPLLHRRDLAVGEKDEDVGAVAAGKCVDRSTAGVAGGGADDGCALAALGKHMVHQPREQLHCHILEGQRRAVEELEDEGVGAGLYQRADRIVPESCIGLAHQPLEDGCRDLAAKERRQHANGKVGISQAAHGADVGGRKLRPFAGHVKPAVARQPGQHRVGKSKHGRIPAGTHILHRQRPIAAGRVIHGKLVNFPSRLSRIFAAALIYVTGFVRGKCSS